MTGGVPYVCTKGLVFHNTVSNSFVSALEMKDMKSLHRRRKVCVMCIKSHTDKLRQLFSVCVCACLWCNSMVLGFFKL